MRAVSLLSILVMTCIGIKAQELKCNVSVNHIKVQNTKKQIFENLKETTETFMNSTVWTDLTFKTNEKIECSIGFIIKSYEDNIIECEMQIQARRPVWGSNYMTSLINMRDIAVKFAYQEFDMLNITPAYENNLVAILSYYAYMIIGYSLDSFQKLGGNIAFNKAENIVNISQSRSEPENAGWRAFDKNSKRYELISNLLDERFRKLREYFYDYHRLGLDVMSSNVANARAKIAEGMKSLQETNKLQPQAQAIISFIDAKKDEIVNIFSHHGTEDEINNVYDIMTAINPSSTYIYNRLKEK